MKLFSGKLKSKWSDPFVVKKVFEKGGVLIQQDNSPAFTVNGHRLKLFVEPAGAKKVLYLAPVSS